MAEEVRRKLIDELVKKQKELNNSKYGELIIQANEVQWYLTNLVWARASCPTKKFKKYLERLELGSLIECFNICVKIPKEKELLEALKDYKKSRNTLAHKMFTSEKLTVKDCRESIEVGNLIIKILKLSLELEYTKRT